MDKTNQTKFLPYTLGLDIGIASVGAALLLPEQKRILSLHVRTFNKAEIDKTGEALNKIRREKRSSRRRLRRRVHRLLRLVRLMKHVGLIEDTQPSNFFLPQTTPWELRSKGLDKCLSPKEWASVIYHIVKHRGYHSTRKSEASSTEADSDQKRMLSGVKHNQDLLEKSEYKTIGQLVFYHADFKESKRNKSGSYICTFSRELLKNELVKLFDSQRKNNNKFAGPEFETKVFTLLMARRPALSGDSLIEMVGKCVFEKDEYRAPKASYRAERFIWLGKLNNLKVVGSGNARPLSETEKSILINWPFDKSKLTYKQMRNALNLDVQDKFNLLSYLPNKKSKDKDKDPEESTFFEATAFHSFRKIYEKNGLKTEWKRDKTNADFLDTLAYALTCYKEDNESRDFLTNQGIDSPIIEAVLEKSFDKFINLSQKALKKILPFMEDGQRYDEAAKSANYNHSEFSKAGKKQKYLSFPDKNIIRNPVVYRAINQSRKLVNAIIKEYGPPASVHIELARDLSKPIGERRRIEKEQREYRSEKDKAEADFQDNFGFSSKKSDLQKWRFFRQQLDQCPYCQKALDINRLFESGYSQIDHILPFSRSWDNSQNNQVVVHTKCNQDKGNCTPYEYLDGVGNSNIWQSFVGWVKSNKTIRQAKRNRLLRVDFGIEESKEFLARNLSDTRYICRAFKGMMENQLQWHSDSKGKEKCLVVSGQATALLRYRWGLLKERHKGDLHHALDAAVIAAASRGLLKRISDYSRRKELKMVRTSYIDPETGEILDCTKLSQVDKDFPLPWPYFRE
jgi:CRISPR-associated endonuclease Csn1